MFSSRGGHLTNAMYHKSVISTLSSHCHTLNWPIRFRVKFCLNIVDNGEELKPSRMTFRSRTHKSIFVRKILIHLYIYKGTRWFFFKKKSIRVRNKNFFFIHKKWVGYFHVLHDPLGHLILLSYVYFIT